MEAYDRSTRSTPPSAANGEYNKTTAPTRVKKVPDNIANLISRDAHRLAKLELYPLNGEDDGSSADEEQLEACEEEGGGVDTEENLFHEEEDDEPPLKYLPNSPRLLFPAPQVAKL